MSETPFPFNVGFFFHVPTRKKHQNEIKSNLLNTCKVYIEVASFNGLTTQSSELEICLAFLG
jgi:hypothetical protein